VPHFHLYFSIHLSKLLGFSPGGRWQGKEDVFDLFEGSYVPDPGAGSQNQIKGKAAEYFHMLRQSGPEDLEKIHIPPDIRKELLEKIILYYQYHMPAVKDLKSPAILHQILNA